MSAYSTCQIKSDEAKLALTQFIMGAGDEALAELMDKVFGDQHLVRFQITDRRDGLRWSLHNQRPLFETP